MGLVESVISFAEGLVGKIMHALLMPRAAPDWYAGSRRVKAFPEPPSESLLLLGHVTLKTADIEAARQFFLEGLGASELPKAHGNSAEVFAIGAFQVRLVTAKSVTAERLCEAWPGHFYVWVENTRRTLSACQKVERKLGVSMVEQIHSVTGEHNVDALELQDPTSSCRLVVNEAPVGGMIDTMRSVLPAHSKASCAVAVINLVHLVPVGTAAGVARFYSHFLGAATSAKKEGFGVDFSLGPALHQTLTFVEDESVDAQPRGEELPEVCMYVRSTEHLRRAFDKCHEAGFVEGAATWEDARKAGEFRFSRCPDPASDRVVLELRHIVRSPEHGEWPLRADIQTRAVIERACLT